LNGPTFLGMTPNRNIPSLTPEPFFLILATASSPQKKRFFLLADYFFLLTGAF
jgi:hypothetical protein